MRTPVLVRRLREISKRAYRDLIAITETIETTLYTSLVNVTDAVTYLKDSIFKFLNLTEDITITETTTSTIVSPKSFSVSEYLSNVSLVIVETLAEVKSAVIKFVIPESISIEETTDVELDTSKSSQISEVLRIILSVADSLAHTVNSVIKTRTNEAISVAEAFAGNLRTSLSYAIDELTHFMLSAIESLSTTKSTIMNALSDEAISVADSLRGIIIAILTLDVTDGLKSIVLKVTEALSTTVSSIVKMLGLSEDLTIAETTRSTLTPSKPLSISDVLSSIQLAIVEALVNTKSAIIKLVTPESISIGETTKSELETSKPYALSDIPSIVASIVESVSHTVSSVIKTKTDELVSITDSLISKLLLFKGGDAPTGGLVGEWLMDEGEGDTIYDTSGQENHGTIYGPGWITGLVDWALNFDGNNDYVNLGTTLLNNPDAGTVCFWLFPTANGESGVKPYWNTTILNKGWCYEAIQQLSDNKIRIYFYDGVGWAWLDSVSSLTLNQWNCVIYAWDASGSTIYLAGDPDVVSDTKTWADYHAGHENQPLHLGGYTVESLPYYYQGIIDIGRIYTRRFNDEEAAQLYRQGLGYSITDHLSHIAFKLTESLSLVSKTIKLKIIGFVESISISDDIKGTISVPLSLGITDIIESISQIRIIESIVHTVTSVIKSTANEALSIADTLGGHISTSTSYTINEATDFVLRIIESLSITKSVIMGGILDDSISIADNIKSTIIATLPLSITDGIASLTLKIVEPLSVVRSSIINLLGLSEDLSIADKIDFLELGGSGSFSVSDDMSCAVACDGGCDVCVNCQDCVTCDKCNVACYTCDVCYGSCFSCETCYALCDAYESCFDCVTCEKCNIACDKCFTCDVSCYTCEECDQACYTCFTCDGTCVTCATCVTTCQVCETCEDGCYTCQKCVTFCQNCFSCEKCDSSCYRCYSCDVSCYSCQECDSSCYSCFTCDGTCFTCATCDGGCESCDNCQDSCYTCQVCVSTCQNCDDCQICDNCMQCYSACYDCDACQGSCYSCEQCDAPCYDCDSCQSMYS